MMINLLSLRSKLLQFKRADQLGRLEILNQAQQIIGNLPSLVKTKVKASDSYIKMSEVATLISYAEALYHIENQYYFDILIDFKMPQVFEKQAFVRLNDYFEFHERKVQMRLKKAIPEIPIQIWELFREAQKDHLASSHAHTQFNLDEFDIVNPPPDQLYPLRIQMMGHYENHAVDRAYANPAGEYLFAKKYGMYELPGGGMVEVHLEKTEDNILAKMLDEHLEEEHANLWLKAGNFYNQVNSEAFIAKIQECFVNLNIKVIFSLASIKTLLESGKTNAAILADLIDLINHYEKEKPEQFSKLANLKATLQVETFKLTSLYPKAIDYIRQNSSLVTIEQFGDTRACGGKQISNSFLMTGKPLESWFEEIFPGFGCEFGDDLRNSEVELITLLAAIAKFKQIKYSHLLIILVNQLKCFERNTLNFEAVWNSNDYDQGRQNLINEANRVLTFRVQ